MGQTASRAFFAPFQLSPHASRTPGILSLLQKPSPGAVPFPLRRLGWMTMGDAMPVSQEEAARRGTRDAFLCLIFPPPTLFMRGRANGR